MNLLLPAAIFPRSKSLIPGSVASMKLSVQAISTFCSIAGFEPIPKRSAAMIASPIATQNHARLHRIWTCFILSSRLVDRHDAGQTLALRRAMESRWRKLKRAGRALGF